ncbi:MAG: NAD-dependent epimerase/dehydratase family protein [Alphaproteobacteria bacterium]|nr:NAD-dependent epimerase/dehydratase family protein [Alphaproteobacteria bacterium]
MDRYPLIAITGGTGWLGQRLVAALTGELAALAPQAAGAGRIRCLVEPGARGGWLKKAGVECVTGDIRDSQAVAALLDGARDALVYHLAGVIHPPGRTKLLHEVNVGGAQLVLEAARKADAGRLVMMSSNSPFGANRRPEDVFDEDSPFNPYMGYGRSKMEMERLCALAMGRAGMPEIVIARAPWFYGPGQPPRQTQFFTMIRRGRFPLMGRGENRRSMGYVDNLALGLLLCGTQDRAANKVYWLADARPYPMAEVVRTVADVLREDFGMDAAEKPLRVPGLIADGARLADAALQVCGIYHQKIHVLSEMNLTIACSIARAREELGFDPPVSLREGMRNSIAWCLEQGYRI